MSTKEQVSSKTKQIQKESPNEVPEKVNKILYTEDGLEIEGYGQGGYVVIVSKDKVEWSDVMEYMSPCYMLVVSFLFYIYTGNLLLLVSILVAGDLYYVTKGSDKNTDNRNLSQKSEKAFFNDKRFWIPLHLFNVLETFAWIWQLVLFSDYVKPDWFIFNLKPTSYS
jgi:hypothetical protein